MYELALFAGAGGGLLATQHLLGWRTVCYVENGTYPVEVLKARIRDGYLDDAPIWGDVRTFDGRPWCGCVDIVTAGFPCQPFSRAGKRLGEQDERNLWPDTARIIRDVRPRYVLLENVPALRCSVRGQRSYFGRVLGDLAESGYDAWWDCIPASAIGANHQRDRLWVVAYAGGRILGQQHYHEAEGRDGEVAVPDVALADADAGGFQEYAQFDGETQPDTTIGDSRRGYIGGCGDQVADADSAGLAQRETEGVISNLESIERSGWWKVEPSVGRVVDGLAHRVDRLAAIGEGQVPAVVKVVWGLLAI